MQYKTNLALKITNWCDMACRHCCERSGKNVAPNFMPIEKVRGYLGEFRGMNIPKFEHLVFTGGEVMAPYYHNERNYIPQCLTVTTDNGFVPFIKTNGMWGGNKDLRTWILDDMANAAYHSQVLTSLEFSVDEFHNNVAQVANIIEQVVKDPVLRPAVRLSLVGLDTPESKNRFVDLMVQVGARGVRFDVLDRMTMALGCKGASHDNDVLVCFDFNTPVARLGRAADNKIGVPTVTGLPDPVTGNCLQITNDDVAVLNYKWREHVNGRPLVAVAGSLFQNIR